MEKIIINGQKTLTGTIEISGAKNSAVALIPASILSDEEVIISNVPNITDREALNEILEYLGAEVSFDKGEMKINTKKISNKEIPEEISKKLRASYYFMGALLSKFKKVKMFFPGGCNIGSRPINLHLKGFELLGAKVIQEKNLYIIEADELKGANIYLDVPSVGATINLMLAASKAQGTTIIENAAKEPEIVNVAIFLNNMGAKIVGAGTSEIKITGVEKLGKCYHEVIPDRIEAGTYLIAGALCGKELVIKNVIPEHLDALISKLKETGTKISIENTQITISKPEKFLPIYIKTLGYPGFPTDLQQPLSTLLTQCEGTSMIEETIWENRFQNLDYLKKMGANIEYEGNKAIIKGKTELNGSEVEATDLRGGACMVLAGLIAKDKTVINNVDHILRGYDHIIEKLKNVGAEIKAE
ncbi:MAG: UDP-N-acetylglucosamine 1-carboxyvinyltransferase [Bacilli bacterium]